MFYQGSPKLPIIFSCYQDFHFCIFLQFMEDISFKPEYDSTLNNSLKKHKSMKCTSSLRIHSNIRCHRFGLILVKSLFFSFCFWQKYPNFSLDLIGIFFRFQCVLNFRCHNLHPLLELFPYILVFIITWFRHFQFQVRIVGYLSFW